MTRNDPRRSVAECPNRAGGSGPSVTQGLGVTLKIGVPGASSCIYHTHNAQSIQRVSDTQQQAFTQRKLCHRDTCRAVLETQLMHATLQPNLNMEHFQCTNGTRVIKTSEHNHGIIALNPRRRVICTSC